MKRYNVRCWNGGPILGINLSPIRFDETFVQLEAESESDAISKAKAEITRDYYEVVNVVQ